MEGLAIVAIVVAAISVGATGFEYARSGHGRGQRIRFARGVEVRVTADGEERRFVLGPRAMRLQGQRLYALLQGEMNLTTENATLVAGEIQRIRSGLPPAPGGAAGPERAPANPNALESRRGERGFQYRPILVAVGEEPSQVSFGSMTSADGRFVVTLSSERRHEIRVDVQDRARRSGGMAVLGIEHDGDWHRYAVPLFWPHFEEDGDALTGTIILPTPDPVIYLDYDVQGMSFGSLRTLTDQEIATSVRLAVSPTDDRWATLASRARPTGIDVEIQDVIHNALRDVAYRGRI